jgi:PhnB protein
MLVPHLYLDGRCSDAIAFYEKAFNTKAYFVQYNSDGEPESGVLHSEMHIHGQRVMMNDRGVDNDYSKEPPIQLVMVFADEKELKDAYQVISVDSTTVIPIGPTFYSPCVVCFLDKFGISWCFMV